MAIHVNHSTDSKGKRASMEFQSDFWKGGTILTLVGCSSGLVRHVEEYRKRGFTKIVIYERDRATYIALMFAVSQHYANDPKITVIVKHGQLENHNFEETPVDAIDFDSCDAFGAVLQGDKCTIKSLFDNKVPVISMTFQSRVCSTQRESIIRLRPILRLSPNSLLRDIIVAYLQRENQGYNFEVFPYRGVSSTTGDPRGGCSMVTIIATLKERTI